MKNNGNNYVINCPIHDKNRSLLIESKRKINQTNRPVEKEIYAEDVVTHVRELTGCRLFDENRQDCEKCHLFALTQKRSVDIYLGAKVMA